MSIISFIQKKNNKIFSSAIFENDQQNWSRGDEKFDGDTHESSIAQQICHPHVTSLICHPVSHLSFFHFY